MLHQLMALHGYERLETPVLQPADLFLTRAGDQIITRLFTFEHNGKQIALRPEYTSPAMSQYIGEGRKVPVRWQFGGIVFEAGADSYLRQHYSIGAEAIGWRAGLADAEILALAVEGVQSAGVTNLAVHVGHVAFLRALLGRQVKDARMQRFLLNHVQTLRQPDGREQVREQIGLLLRLDLSEAAAAGQSPSPAIVDALLQPLERSQLMGGRTREDIQRRLLTKLERAESLSSLERGMDELEHLIALEGTPRDVMPALRGLCADDRAAAAMLDEWETLLRLGEMLGVAEDQVVLTPALSRNWDYYSGMVFELHSGSRHLGGGGRYDDLARLLGSAEAIPSVGLAWYADAVLEACPPGRFIRQTASVALSGPLDGPFVARWAKALRAEGLVVSLLPEPGDRSLMVDSGGRLHVGDSDFALADAKYVASHFLGDVL